MSQGPNNPPAGPNISRNPQGPFTPFLWREADPSIRRFIHDDQMLPEQELMNCQTFARNRGVAGPLTEPECADLLARLGKTQAHQTIIDRDEFKGRLSPTSVRAINLPAVLLGRGFEMLDLERAAVQRMEFGDEAMWGQIVAERTKREANQPLRSDWPDFVYDVYVTLSRLVADGDLDPNQPPDEYLFLS